MRCVPANAGRQIDARNFNQLARALSADGTRRGLLQRLAALPLGGALAAALGTVDGGAAKKSKRRKRRRKKLRRCKKRLCSTRCGVVRKNVRKRRSTVALATASRANAARTPTAPIRPSRYATPRLPVWPAAAPIPAMRGCSAMTAPAGPAMSPARGTPRPVGMPWMWLSMAGAPSMSVLVVDPGKSLTMMCCAGRDNQAPSDGASGGHGGGNVPKCALGGGTCP